MRALLAAAGMLCPALVGGAAGAAVPVALLPPDARELPAEAVRAAAVALERALPPPFVPAALDPALVRAHLDSAGPACRHDPACLCAAVPLEADALALDVELSQPVPGGAWAADVALLRPCEGALLGRRAELIAATSSALSRWIAQAGGDLLRGRDLGPLRYSADGGALTVVPNPVSAARAAAVAAPALAGSTRSARALARVERGRARLQLAQVTAAATDFSRAHELDPALAAPLYWMAEAARRLGLLAEARGWYAQYVASSAPDVDAALREQARRWVDSLGGK